MLNHSHFKRQNAPNLTSTNIQNGAATDVDIIQSRIIIMRRILPSISLWFNLCLDATHSFMSWTYLQWHQITPYLRLISLNDWVTWELYEGRQVCLPYSHVPLLHRAWAVLAAVSSPSYWLACDTSCMPVITSPSGHEYGKVHIPSFESISETTFQQQGDH